MWYAIAAAWWLSAFLPLFFVTSDRESLTWGGLLILILVSCIGGPILGAAMGLAILSQAEFWDKPIWSRKKE
jgi:hypothetical protein